MNYRQWKKNYKKRHRHNPPLETDKRQQAKALKKAMRNTSVTINDITAADAAQSVAERIERGSE